MTKRKMTAAVAMAIVLAMAMPALAAAAPASQTIGPAAPSMPWYAQSRPFQIWPGWGYKPWGGTGLEYQLRYVASSNEVQLIVVNDTAKSITVSAPSGQLTDFALWRNGRLVWRASTDRVYTQAVTNVTFRPGEGKVYKESLPYLGAGTYFLQGYFIPETRWAPVASAYITVGAYEPLRYGIEYLGPGWFNSAPRLRVTIKNTSGRDITLPYQYGYQILVKKPGAREYLGHVGMGQSLGTLEAGASRYVFVNLNNLEPGTYQADVRSNVANGWYRVVAQTWFYVR